jgi:hypothetical protein
MKNLRSLSRLNLADNQIVSPEPVLAKMWWCSVIPSCAVMLTEKSSTVFTITAEESEYYEGFLKHKGQAEARKLKAKLTPLGLTPSEPKKGKQKIILH